MLTYTSLKIKEKSNIALYFSIFSWLLNNKKETWNDNINMLTATFLHFSINREKNSHISRRKK